MKFSKCATALLVTSFLLTGCQSGSKTVKEDGKYVVASLNKGGKEKNIYADDIFKDLIGTTSGKNTYFDAVLQQLMDQKFPVDEDMETDADDTVQQIKDYYNGQYGENGEEQLKTQLATFGFNSIEAYRNYVVSAYQKYNFLLDYVENNFDKVYDDYYIQASPREASIIKVSMMDVENPTSEETKKLNEVQALLKSSKSFGDIAKDYSDDENTNKKKGKLGIIDTSTGLAQVYGKDVETKALALTEGEVSSPIKGSDGFYIVKVTNTNKASIKKMIKNDLSIDTPLIAYDPYMTYVAYQSYEVKYENKRVEKLINEVLDAALKEREISRGGND